MGMAHQLLFCITYIEETCLHMNKVRDDKTPVILRGIILPDQWDDAGSIISFSLMTDDEDRFFIEYMDYQENVLLSFLRKKVEVSGIVKSTKRDEKVITLFMISPIGENINNTQL